MNTTTEDFEATFEQAEDYAFAEPSAAEKPTLICIGTVGEVEDTYISTSEKSGIDHYVTPISLEGEGTSRNFKVWLVSRPEYFSPKFGPADLTELEGEAKDKESPRRAEHFLYTQNIASKDKYSTLRGLAGSKDAFLALARALKTMPQADDIGGPTPDTLTTTLREFFESNVNELGLPRRVGYILRQRKSDTGLKDSEGKKIYQNESQYNLQSWFDPTDKELAKRYKKATQSEGKTLCCYENPE